ncbi:MAG: hypothetical protein IPP94_06820 [Ignavibacteria bacterium]|nr:hypothetical protein [Ignavibacteria bacterium]
MKTLLFFLLLAIASAGAQPAAKPPSRISAIAVPTGFTRIAYAKDSFSEYLRALPLKADREIRSFNGSPVQNSIYAVLAVLDMPLLFKADLEQCADFCMRLWAEWHKASGRLRELSLFNFSGTRVRYSTSGLSERNFLRRAFAYSNSHSLKKGCAAVDEKDLRPGDMVVQNERGGIGHVSMIMDACESPKGERLYLIGFGFMPAQEFHLERADARNGRDGWYTIDGFYRYLAENLNVGKPVLRRL